MGMFDKDKLFAPNGQLREWVDNDVPFILRDMEYRGDIETPNGPTATAPIVWLHVSPKDSPGKTDIVSMVGDLAKEKAEAKSDGDLPCMVVAKNVPSSIEGGNDAYVINWYGDYSDNGAKDKGK